ncbi:hypothetical protein, partial [Escherichia coli]|uniref:hypothetical protein n=1 Tax=Escherichia coli TaxID=562 RepID=UPI002FBE5A2F
KKKKNTEKKKTTTNITTNAQKIINPQHQIKNKAPNHISKKKPQIKKNTKTNKEGIYNKKKKQKHTKKRN